MKILILEDEPLVAKDLVKLIKRLEPDAEILAILHSVEDAVKWLQNNSEPSLIISDIQLSDGTCFEIFEEIKPRTPIIFSTAYDEYALKSFKHNSIDYLLKPIDVHELKDALEKYKNLGFADVGMDRISAMLKSFKMPQKYKERFLVLFKNAHVPIPANDVAYFHKEELIYLYTKNNERYLVEFKSLEELEHLIDPEIFYRVNRQFIVNVEAVSKLKSTIKGMSVLLKPPLSIEIDISREKATGFKRWVDR